MQFIVPLPANYLRWVPLKLLSRDPDSLSERVRGHSAVKALHLPTADGPVPIALQIEWREAEALCRVESPVTLDLSAVRAAEAMARRIIGVHSDPTAFESHVETAQPPAGMNGIRLSDVIGGRRGLRIAQYADIFEGVAWAIIGQQITLSFAYKLRRVVVQRCGTPLSGGLIAQPTAAAVAALDYADLTAHQFSRRKAEYLIDTARLITNRALILDPAIPAPEMESRLLAVRGLGPWSTNYLMMRAMAYPDCVPLGDTGLSTALQRFYKLDHRPKAAETGNLMQPFAPFRSLATYHLWMNLGEPLA
jgi:3-methyladenine DNA glycosylase/8-oxoguanine DNA glycosylase